MANRAPEFFRKLNEQALEAMEEFARQPGRTGDDVLEWLAGRGVQASRSAVYRWLQDFRIEDGHRRTMAIAHAKLAAVCDGDAAAVSRANVYLLNDRLAGVLGGGEDLSSKEIRDLSAALKSSVDTSRQIEELEARVRELERERTAIREAAERAASAGGSGAAVRNAVCEAMGLKAA